MRVWTLHPRYLDAKGLVAAWRETLLAQKVLRGETRGYRNHPQLSRFKIQPDARAAIAAYLSGLFAEAVARGYSFDRRKILGQPSRGRIVATRGQLDYEWLHLLKKLKIRDRKRFDEFGSIRFPEAHPLFRIVPGEVEPWEILSGAHAKKNTPTR